jgi:hypothetical protein
MFDGGEKADQNRTRTAVTATMLIRFCVAIDNVYAAWISAWPDLDFLPFVFFGFFFPAMAITR